MPQLDRPLVVSAHPDSDLTDLAPAVHALHAGRLVAFPTETVYGLGAAALDPDAVARIFAAKGRPADNPLIVHLADTDELPRVTHHVTPLARDLAARWWPGPLTLVLTADPRVPTITTGGLDTIAVRVPAHPVAQLLLRDAGIPVAAPSANQSGAPSPTCAEHVISDLGGLVAVVIDGGACRLGIESTVVDARGDRPVVLREGMVTREQLGLSVGHVSADSALTPGGRYRHYAPHCTVEVAPPGGGPQRATELANHGAAVGLVAGTPAPKPVRCLATVHTAEELGQTLYAALRAADTAELDVIVIEAVAEDGLGRAVMDRVRRAAGG